MLDMNCVLARWRCSLARLFLESVIWQKAIEFKIHEAEDDVSGFLNIPASKWLGESRCRIGGSKQPASRDIDKTHLRNTRNVEAPSVDEDSCNTFRVPRSINPGRSETSRIPTDNVVMNTCNG